MPTTKYLVPILFHLDNLRSFSFKHMDVASANRNIDDVAIALRPDFMRTRFNYFSA
ncbi:MAG: hypothetical protein ABL895_03770 [Cyclobacteriaceae bacterium]